MNPKAWKAWSWEAVCLFTYTALAGIQLFLPPIVGLADNGDFPKVLSPQSVCDPSHQKDAFAYVTSRYIIAPRCYWDSRLPSSETALLAIVKWFATTSGRDTFRITGIAKLHLPFMLAAFMILLWALHSAPAALRFGVPPFVILVFSDVAYVSYLNSFFMDAASMVFLLPVVALAAAWLLRPRTWIPIAFAIIGIPLGFAKTQHSITSFILAGLAVWFAVRAFRQSGRLHGWCWVAAASTVAVSTLVLIAMTPKDYKAEPLYSLVFFRVLPSLPDKAEALADFGLPEAYVEFSGTHAYSKDAPVMNQEWRDEFDRQLSYTGVAAFYLQNPLVTLNLIWRGLKDEDEAKVIRPLNLANYEREAGFPPVTLAHHFDSWTNLRACVLRTFPPGLPIFYCSILIASFRCLFRPSWAERWPLYPLVLALAVSGVVEFLFVVLLDGTETSRHLFLFQVITELLNVCVFAAVAQTLVVSAGSRLVSILRHPFKA